MSDFARTEFLARLAHDLRNAAATSGAALDELARPDVSDAPRYLAIARRGVGRVLRIGDSLSEAAELEAGPLRLSRAPQRLADLVARASAGAIALEHRRGVDVTLDVPTDLVVDVDGPRVVRVVFELVSNAIRAAERLVEISAVAAPGATTLSISDDGARSPVIAPRFTPSDSRGLGLGVPMAVEVMAAHGGRIEPRRADDRTLVDVVFVGR